jgi:hypothetical protein
MIFVQHFRCPVVVVKASSKHLDYSLQVQKVYMSFLLAVRFYTFYIYNPTKLNIPRCAAKFGISTNKFSYNIGRSVPYI